MRLAICRDFLGIFSVTIKRLGDLSLDSVSSCSTGAFLAVDEVLSSLPRSSLGRSSLGRSSFDFASPDFKGDFFIRNNSSSTIAGSVGDNSSGIWKGDLGLLLGVGSGFFGFVGRVPSTASSLALFFSLFSAASWLSRFKRRGDNKGGTDDFEGAADALLFGVFLELLGRLGRAPLTESPLARPAGDALRLTPIALLRTLRPLGNSDEWAGLLSRDGSRS